jgi:O-antigen/teichoic acid export membrane protein
MYPYLLNKEKVAVDRETKKEIVKNTKAMMMHKIGGVVVNSTDNIILSKFVGLTSVGLYSNYYLITNALNLIFGQIYSSLTASIGNLCISSNKEKQCDIFNKQTIYTNLIQ